MIFINNIEQLKNQNPNPGTEFYNLQTGHEYVYTGHEYVDITKGIPTNGLVAHYSMNNIVGTTVVDETGNYNALATGITIEDGVIDDSAHFDGSNSFITVPGGVIDTMDNGLTISIWLNYTNTDFAHLFQATETAATNRLNMHWDWYGTSFVDIGNISAGGRLSFTTDTSLFGKWIHFAVTSDGSTGKAYINGELIGSLTNTSAFTATSRTLYIGKQDPDTSNDFVGNMDNIKIDNRSLTHGEVYALSKELSN